MSSRTSGTSGHSIQHPSCERGLLLEGEGDEDTGRTKERAMAASSWKDYITKKMVFAILLGQFLSFLVTSTGFTSSELARRGVNAPTSQSFANYVLLALVYGGILLYKRKPLKARWYFYLILGLVDVEANYLVVKAYQYTNLTSVMLLDCWAIPCVLLLTWLFLKTKYRFKKLTGVVLCVAGIVMVIFSDVHASDRSSAGPKPFTGDMFVLAGATLYAVSNVSEEFLVKNADRVELMAMLGFFGAIFSAIQISILERGELRSIHWSANAVLPFVGFGAAMFFFYSLVPVLLKESGSAMLNLSLLTSDMWAVVIRIFAYNEKVDWIYYIAFAAVVVGLVIYSWGDKNQQQTSSEAESEEETNQSKRFDTEAGIANPYRETCGNSRFEEQRR